MNVSFMGHIEECLGHLSKEISKVAPRGSQKSVQAKKPIAEFCGATIATVTRWLNRKAPLGETLIRLMFYLDSIGYTVIELKRMPAALRNFAELIGFGVLSGEEATQILGYAKKSSLCEIILRGRGTARTSVMWDVWKERKSELEVRKGELKKFLVLGKPQTSAAVNIMAGLLTLLECSPTIKDEELEESRDTLISPLIEALSRLRERR